jgi:oxygen-independent coproporphyrinogen III oxidase
MPLGLYISIPFCRTKCSYCNFASDVFGRAVFQNYVDRVCSDMDSAQTRARQMNALFDPIADSVYLGGGTPTLLDIPQLERILVNIRQNFHLQADAETTVECAPGTLSPSMIEVLRRSGVNRVSLGVQSFVDIETASVGRLHRRTDVLDDIARLRAAGISNINIDLIAGLPHQTAESWNLSLEETIAVGVPHVSVYMLEVDQDSRLGRELMAGGTKYHAHFVPDEDLIADLYETACERLRAVGIAQYEISNFARPGRESKHNLKYWTRQPYLGFGVDAHSMLVALNGEGHGSERANSRCSVSTGFTSRDEIVHSVRLAFPDSLEGYMAGGPPRKDPISLARALEETFFLGLRLNRGMDLRAVEAEFGTPAIDEFGKTINQLRADGLLELHGDALCLTPTGRLLSNEVFEQFILLESQQKDSNFEKVET